MYQIQSDKLIIYDYIDYRIYGCSTYEIYFFYKIARNLRNILDFGN